MFRSHQFIVAWFAIGALALVPRVSDGANADLGSLTQVVDLAPFTHNAYIPPDADISSIKLRGIKVVKIATKQRSATSLSYCEERLRAAEPGGSMYCQLTTDDSPVPAYKVTYSYTAPPMPSDEYGGRSFTFDVYFRPGEMSPGLRKALSSKRVSRTDLSEYFQVSTNREFVQQVVVDDKNSTVCDGNYVDGNWVQTNPKCQEAIVYKKVASPSPYIAVRIDPVSRVEANAATTGFR